MLSNTDQILGTRCAAGITSDAQKKYRNWGKHSEECLVYFEDKIHAAEPAYNEERAEESKNHVFDQASTATRSSLGSADAQPHYKATVPGSATYDW